MSSQSEARRMRRACKRGGHIWKAGSRPEDGRFCAWVIEDLGKYFRVRHRDTHDTFASGLPSMRRARQDATTAYRRAFVNGELPYTVEDVQRELAGHDLCCWCPPTPLNPNGSMDWLGLQCHAEVLLEFANLEASE